MFRRNRNDLRTKIKSVIGGGYSPSDDKPLHNNRRFARKYSLPSNRLKFGILALLSVIAVAGIAGVRAFAYNETYDVTNTRYLYYLNVPQDGNYGTALRYYYPGDGSHRPVYCVQPSNHGNPVNTTLKYTAVSLTAMQGDTGSAVKNEQLLKAIMWFGVDSPGYDASLWECLGDGRPYSCAGEGDANGGAVYGKAEWQYICAHVLISCIVSGDQWGSWGLSGSALTFFQQTVLGTLKNNIAARQNEVPEGFEIFFLEDKSYSYNQILMSWNYTPKAPEYYLKIEKRDAETGQHVSQAGFQFEINGPNSPSANPIGALTESDGWTPNIKVSGPGTYYITETKVPNSDYLLSSETVTVNVTEGNDSATPASVVFSNKPRPKKGGIEIEKDFESSTGGSSAYSLAGAVYGIYSSRSDASAGRNPIKRLTTDSSGHAATGSDELEEGTYYVKEITAPAGCELDTTIYEVKVPGGSYAIVKSEDPIITGSIQIQKQNASGQDLNLSGFVFTATSRDGLRRTATTNSQGVATFDDLPLGTWTVRETTAQPPYLLNSGWSKTFNITEDNAHQTFSAECQNTPATGKVTLQKTDSSSGDAIAGVEFELHVGSSTISTGNGTATFNGKQCTANALLGTYKTDSDGRITISGLPLGTSNSTRYYFQEKTPKIPYTLDNGGRYDFSLTYNQNSAVVSVNVNATNTPAVGKAELVKVDSDTGRKLSGAIFKVVAQEDIFVNGEKIYSNGDVITGNERLTTDDEGKITTTNLPVDDDGEAEYAFVEVQEPIGYQLDTTPHPFTITYVDENTPNPPTVSSGEVKDLPVYGGIEIHKVDLDIAKVHGVDVDGRVQGNATTFDGVRFDIVNEGTYSISIDDVVYEPGDKLGEIELEDGSKGYLTIKDGVAKTAIDALPYGDYAVTEVADTTPEGYVVNQTTWHVKIRNLEQYHYPEGDEIDGKVSNDVEKGRLEMPKIDHDYAENAELGQADAENNPQGDAKMAGAEFSIENASTNPVVVGSEDDPHEYANGERITTIPRSDGSVGDTIVAGDDGIAATADRALPYGTYIVREVKAPEGYHLNSTDYWTVTIDEDGQTIKASGDDRIDDEVIRGGVAMPKIDTELSEHEGEETKENNPQGDATVEGAEFTICNRSEKSVYVNGALYAPGDDIMTIKTGADGIATTGSDTLPYGSYDLRETKAPDGYLDSSVNHDGGEGEVWEFEIVEDGEIVRPDKEKDVEHKIDNQVIRGDVKMPKIDSEMASYDGQDDESNPQGDATLEGAVFTIKNMSKHQVLVNGELYATGEDIMTIETDADGIAQTTGKTFPYGTYELRETKAPDGYTLTDEVWTFKIRTDGEVKEPADVDEKIDNIPIRGGVEMPKVDADLIQFPEYEDAENTPQGNGTFDGAEFAIDNISTHHVKVGGKIYESGERIATIPDGNKDGAVADVIVTVDGVARTTTDALPYGTYEIYEVKAPNGYELSDDSWVFSIGDDDNGKLVRPADAEDKIADTVEHNKPHGAKTDEELNERTDVVSDSSDIMDDADDDATDGAERAGADDDILSVVVDLDPQTNAQGDATLEGAEFYLVNSSDNLVIVGGEIYQPGDRITTIPQVDGSISDVVTSDARGVIEFGDDCLPYGTYTLGEETAPEGYNLSDDTWTFNITADSETYPQSTDDSIEDSVIHGGLSVQKVDKETGKGDSIVTGDSTADDATDDAADDVEAEIDATEAQTDDSDGADDDTSDDSDNHDDAEFRNASLADTMFEIRNASDKAVIVDGKLYQVGQVVKTITTDDKGYAATEPNALPYGTYDVYEVSAPNGYISSADSYGNSDGKDDESEKAYVQTVEIRQEGVIVPCTRPFANQIKRGDITFTKIDDDGNVMPHVAFRVTSKTTGESHIIVTDENGAYNSSSSVVPHSQNTNANDDAFGDDGNIDDDKLVYDAGTWFYGNADGKTFYDDEKQTLPNNADRFTPAESVDTGTSDDASDDAAASDDESTDADGSTDDTQDDADGSEQDGNDSDVETMANDDELTDGDGNLVLGDDVEGGSGSSAGSSTEPVHVNPVYEVTDEDGATKQVTIGYVQTDDNGSFENNSVVFNADGSITVVYDSTVVDENGNSKSYTRYETYADGNWKVIVVGSDMLDGTNADGIADADGNGEFDIVDNPDAYTNTTQYPMRSVDDNLGAFPYDEYIFEELPSDATYGRNLVAFEATVQRHNYVLDLGPITDNVIDIHTTATDQTDGDHVFTTDGTVTIVDTVEYTNLNTDREYTMTGTLMDYETGEPMTDANGNTITSSTTFTPSSANGSVDIVFELDASQLGGVQTVVFEDLYWDNIRIATHSDIEDKGQRVEFHPEIGTTATADSTNDHFAYADGSVIITDTVHYKGAVPGREFIVHGILMDKNTGDALVDSNGETVENSVVFTPKTSEGDVQVSFEFDATNLAGLDVVVFEDLYRIDAVTSRQPDENGDSEDVPATQRLVASHKDINDEGQTVNIRANDLASDQIASDLVQTGAMVGGGVLAAAVVGGTIYEIRKRRKNA